MIHYKENVTVYILQRQQAVMEPEPPFISGAGAALQVRHRL